MAEAAAVAVADDSFRIVNIPIGLQDLGIEFTGSPPVITNVDFKSPLEGQAEVGLYVHVLVLPELEIVNVNDSNHLLNLLNANISQPRQLYLSVDKEYVDASLGSAHHGALYKHKLPATPNLGVSLTAFPPIVTSVAEYSAMRGRLIPGQTVEALLIPGKDRMDLAAGAFTSARVEEALQQSSNITGRVLGRKRCSTCTERERDKCRNRL